MKKIEIELKNCPNCNERIGKQDVECPYCKYIDDPKYKKYNEKLKRSKINKKKVKNNKNNVYKILLLIPLMSYLGYLIINNFLSLVIISLILLNILCFVMKKIFALYVIIIEIIALLFNFCLNVYDMSLVNSFKGLTMELVTLLFGFVLVIVPKYIYLIKSKKVRKTRKR